MTTKTFVSGNWNGGVWSPVGDPTAADDVKLDATSGNCAISGTCLCRSIDCTGYTNTLTHTSGGQLTIGDATAGTGNIALKFVAGMTLTKSTNAVFNFVSTSTTQQTITLGGKVLGDVTFSGAGGSWIFSDTFTTTAGATTLLTLTQGSLNFNGQTVSTGRIASSNSNTRSLTTGAANISLDATATGWDMTTVTGLTLNASGSTITFTGSAGTLVATGLSLGDVVMNGSGQNGINSNVTIANLTRTGTAVKTGSLALAGDVTVTGTFTCTGNSKINRLLVRSLTTGTPRTISAAVVSVNATDFKDITGAGAASWDLSAVSNFSGDCGGNSGITFTSPETQTSTGTASFTWSTHGWTSRVPLPQDDVVVNNAFVAGRTVTADMPRMGKSITFGCTGSPTITLTVSPTSLFGSLDLTGIGSLTGSPTLQFEGRGSFLLTSAGITFPSTVTLLAFGGSLTLQDAFTSSGQLIVTNGAFDANDFNATCLSFQSSNSNVRTISMGNGTWGMTGTGTNWNTSAVTNLTFNSEGSTLKFTNATNNVITFQGGSQTYNNIWFSRSTSTQAITIAGSNTFNDLKDDGSVAHSLLFTQGTTQTVNTFTVSGTAGNVITIDSASGSTSVHNLVKSGGGVISRDYLNIQHSVAIPAATWFAGTNSTNNQGVATVGSGWTFSLPVATSAVSLVGGSSTLSSSTTFVGSSLFTAAVALTGLSSTLAAPATNTNPVYTTTVSLTGSSSILVSADTFSPGTKTANAALVSQSTTLASTDTFSPGTKTATSFLIGGSSTLVSSSTFSPGTKAASVTLLGGSSTLVGSVSNVNPVYAASVALNALGSVLEASTTFVVPSYTANTSLNSSSSTLTANVTHTAPTRIASVNLIGGASVLSSTVTFVSIGAKLLNMRRRALVA